MMDFYFLTTIFGYSVSPFVETIDLLEIIVKLNELCLLSCRE